MSKCHKILFVLFSKTASALFICYWTVWSKCSRLHDSHRLTFPHNYTYSCNLLKIIIFYCIIIIVKFFLLSIYQIGFSRLDNPFWISNSKIILFHHLGHILIYSPPSHILSETNCWVLYVALNTGYLDQLTIFKNDLRIFLGKPLIKVSINLRPSRCSKRGSSLSAQPFIVNE